MTSYNITKKQGQKLEIERRNSLASYLVKLSLSKQQMYLEKLKSDELRADLDNRMRDALAQQIARLDDNMRKLRLSRMYQRCQRKHFTPEYFQDVLARVNRLLETQTEKEPAKETSHE